MANLNLAKCAFSKFSYFPNSHFAFLLRDAMQRVLRYAPIGVSASRSTERVSRAGSGAAPRYRGRVAPAEVPASRREWARFLKLGLAS